ncbi:MAG: (Fe-S)-binding protein [Chitinophagaceae bacterium]|nr:(Fe-S)-binding protein [Chitinophagaceae bacterium]
MHILQQIFFLLILGAASFLFYKKIRAIRRNIFLGRPKTFEGDPAERWRNVVLLALGQKKMFKRITPAVLHFFVYAGFVIINIEMLEIILDGILGTHRLFAPFLGALYPVLISCFEILAATVLIACAIFLVRRNVLKLKRLVQGELNGWPKTDANLILATEIILMSLLLILNATDLQLQNLGAEHYTQTGSYLVSGLIAPLFKGMSVGSLIAVERVAWWLHIIGVLAFLNYLPYSKHLHIVLAFPNAYYAPLKPQGEMQNMPAVQNEVLYMMQPELAPPPAEGDPTAPQRFGAKDVMDLSWKSLMDAYSCTECGRCTAVCPANITGKKLSPRKIMMDTRDRLEEVGKNIDLNGSFTDDGKSLVHDYITSEELRACTTCNACVEACPVSISPLDIIVEARRYLVMEESNSPQEWNMMFGNIENNMAPWKFSPDERDKWVEELV